MSNPQGNNENDNAKKQTYHNALYLVQGDKKFHSSNSVGMCFCWKNQNIEMRVKVLKIISTCCSFVYYFTDNIVFLASVDFVSPKVPYAKNLKWK